MTFKKLCLQLAKKEGLKKEVNIAQMREILSHLCDIIYDERVDQGYSKTLFLLITNGEKRNARKQTP